MGPRLFSRGNGNPQRTAEAKIAVLQWGHDFSAVEMALTHTIAIDGVMLQWGHDFSAVEIMEFQICQILIARSASMGPRLFSRGNFRHQPIL